MELEQLVLDALHDPDKDLDSKSGTVEIDGKSYSATCYIHKSGRMSVLLDPTLPDMPPLSDIMVAGKDTRFRFEPPRGTKTLGDVLVDTGRLNI